VFLFYGFLMKQDETRKTTLSILVKLVTSIVIIVSISILSVVGAALYYITINQQGLNKEKMNVTSNTLIRELEDYREDYISRTKAFVALDSLIRAIRLKDAYTLLNDSSKLRKHFRIDLFELLTPKLRVLSRGHVQGVYGDSRKGHDLLTNLFLDSDVPLKERYIAYIERDKIIPLLEEGEPVNERIILREGYFLKVARPIVMDVDEGEMIGVLVLGKYIGDKLINKFKEISRSEIVLFYNGDAILASDNNLSDQQFDLANTGIISKQVLPTLGTASYMTKKLVINDKQRLEVAVIISEQELNLLFDILTKKIILLSIWILLFFIIVTFFLAKSMSKPIIYLTKSVETIISGNLDKEVRPTTHDEIGVLAYNFDRMRLAIKKRLHELALLDTATKEITKLHERDKVLSFSLETIVELAAVNKGKLYLLDGEGELSLRAIYGIDVGAVSQDDDARDIIDKDSIDLEIARGVLESRKRYLTNEAVAIPLEMDNEILGVMILKDHKQGQYFSSENTVAAVALSGAISISLKNIELLEMTEETARMEKELETTKTVQSLFFPPSEMSFAKSDLLGFAEPATECGGDLWGYFRCDDESFFVFVADATGHGVPAALVTAAARSVLYLIEKHVQNKSMGKSAKAIMTDLNNTIYNTSKQKVMMTFFLGLVDESEGTFTFCNAGHNFPYYMDNSAKKIVPILDKKSQGPRLGFDPDFEYGEAVIKLPENYTLFAYTDGLIEAVNPEQVEYGEKKLRRLLKKTIGQELATIYEEIKTDNSTFRRGTPLEDDSTWFVLKSK